MNHPLSALVLCLALGACATIPPPSVGEIVALAKAGRSATEIVAQIDAGAGVYPMSASEIARLSREGVPDGVLDYMLHVWLDVETRRAYLDGQMTARWPHAWPFYRYSPQGVAVAPGGGDTPNVATGASAAAGQIASTPSDAAVVVVVVPTEPALLPTVVEPVVEAVAQTAPTTEVAHATSPAEEIPAADPVASAVIALPTGVEIRPGAPQPAGAASATGSAASSESVTTPETIVPPAAAVAPVPDAAEVSPASSVVETPSLPASAAGATPFVADPLVATVDAVAADAQLPAASPSPVP